MTTVTAAEVRSVSGATIALITDQDIDKVISLKESETEVKFDIKLVPTEKIEILTGEYKRKLLVDEYFPLTVYNISNGETDIDLQNMYIDTEQGFLEFIGDSISGGIGFPYSTTRFSFYDLDVKVKYLYGMMQKDTTITTETSDAVEAGAAVSIEVDDSSSFTVDDYVFIEDLNRANEVFKITVIADSTHITAKILTKDYVSGAIVSKAKLHEIIKQYILYDSAYTVANYIVGNTSDLPTGWSQEGVQVQVGVAYTHWRDSRDSLKKQRDEVESKVRNLLGTLV